MNSTKPKPVKAVKGYQKISPPELSARAAAVLGGIYGNAADFVNPPFDQATFKAQVDAYQIKITAALDGGKKAIAERNHQGAALIKMLKELAAYAEKACNNDITIFLKSGLQAQSTVKVLTPPRSKFIRRIDPGPNSGQTAVTIVDVKGASGYDLRWAPIVPGGAPGTWTNQQVSKTRPPTVISGLTRGTDYAFQVRSLTNSVYSDWSDSVTEICK